MAEGKVRCIGISNFYADGFSLAANKMAAIDAVVPCVSSESDSQYAYSLS